MRNESPSTRRGSDRSDSPSDTKYDDDVSIYKQKLLWPSQTTADEALPQNADSQVLCSTDRVSESLDPQLPLRSDRAHKRRWLGVAIIAMLNFMSAFSVITYAPVADLTRQHFGLTSLTPINWLYISAAFVYVGISPLSYLITQRSAKAALVLGSSLLITGSWLRYLAARIKSYPCLLIGSMLCGASQPFALNIPSHYSDLWFTQGSRVTATALMSLANPLGQAIGSLVVPFMAPEVAGISTMSLCIALLFTCTTSLSVITPARPPSMPSPMSHEPKLNSLDSLRVLTKNTEFLCILVPFTVLVAAFNGFASLIEQFIAPYGFSDIQAGIVGAVMVVSGLIVGAITAPIFDKTKAWKIPIIVAVCATAVSYFGLLFSIRDYSAGIFITILILVALIGGSGLMLLPLALELASDVTFPVAPELSSSVLWLAGQGLGGILSLMLDSLRTADHKYTHSLVFLTAVSFLPIPFAIALVRSERVEGFRTRRSRDGFDEVQDSQT